MAVVLLLSSLLMVISFAAPGYFINAQIQSVLRKVFGYSSFLVPLVTGVSGLLFIDSIKSKIKDVRILIGFLALTVTVAGFFHLFIDSQEARQMALDGRGGGLVGFFVATSLKNMISVYGGVVVLLALGIVSLILILNISIDEGIEFYKSHIATGDILRFKNKPQDQIEMQEGMGEFSGDDEDEAVQPEIPFSKELRTEEKQVKVKDEFEIIPTMSEPQAVVEPVLVDSDKEVRTIAPGTLPYIDRVWKLPGADLLDDVEEEAPDTGDVETNKKIIKDTLSSFSIPANVVDVEVGSSVTRYALDTPPGIRINRVSNLQHDLALALASPTGSVRIEAPIPGKALIGIEVPNRIRAKVSYKTIVTSEPFKNSKSKLTVGLGKDVGGVTHVYEIGRMPHLLIAGATNSGKSVFIHNIIFSLLFRATPQEVKLILMDFKRGVELNVYDGLPHLYAPLVTDIDKAPAVFKWAETEMMRRFRMLESARAKNIEAYNEKSGFQALPYIVIIVDELADIMVRDPTMVEKSIIRLAQLARATGIHLVLAVQRPSTDVITGLIKANIPCRVAFNVINQVNSRVIIDQAGAEKLLGQGDMLFIPPDRPTPTRLQSAFISDDEKSRVVQFLKDQGVPPEYKEDIFDTPTDGGRGKSIAAGGDEKDDLYDEAAQIIISAGKGSASLLQRRLSIGYARAARIIDELEKNGIVGPAQGSRAREVLTETLPEDVGGEADPFDELDVDDEEDQ